jgi:hypothetical protein
MRKWILLFVILLVLAYLVTRPTSIRVEKESDPINIRKKKPSSPINIRKKKPSSPINRGSTKPYGSSSRRWVIGGNLHKATVGEWKNASYQNKLATAADWLAGTKWKGHLTSPNDFNRLKPKAQMLVYGVDASIAGQPVDYLKAAEIAAALIMMSNDLGP